MQIFTEKFHTLLPYERIQNWPIFDTFVNMKSDAWYEMSKMDIKTDKNGQFNNISY